MTKKEYEKLRKEITVKELIDASCAIDYLLERETKNGLRWLCAFCYMAGRTAGCPDKEPLIKRERRSENESERKQQEQAKSVSKQQRRED